MGQIVSKNTSGDFSEGSIGQWSIRLCDRELQWSENVYRLYRLNQSDTKATLKLWLQQSYQSDRAKLEACLDNMIVSGLGFSCRIRKASNSASQKILLITGISQKYSGAEDYVCGTIQELQSDEEEIVNLKGRLAHSLKNVEEFTNIAAHDLKAPLRAIRNSTQWLEDILGNDAGTEARLYIDRIRYNSHRMSVMLSQLFLFSKIGLSKVPNECIDPRSVIRDIISSAQAGHRVELEVVGEMPVLFTGRDEFKMVWKEVLENAIVHNDKQIVKVRIHCFSDRDFHHFHVSDNGPGIVSSNTADLFQPFRKTDNTRPDSAGMGLAIARKALCSCGGDIQVCVPDQYDLNGAVFSLDWPV